jgi:glutaredoxin
MSNDGMNGEVGVRIVTLSDCDYCIWLKNELDGCGINYTNIDVDMFKDFVDALMDKLKTDGLPLVIIDLGPKIISIVGGTELEESETLRTFESIPHLVGIIKSYIK